MRIAFYAPLKPPTHATPSGDRRVGRLLLAALQHAGHEVELVSSFQSFDRDGDRLRQMQLRDQGLAIADELVRRWTAPGNAPHRPALWFTYHLYYKAPDWLGPLVSRALDIPYVVAEASHAAKRAGGPWAIGHEQCELAIGAADLLLCPSRDDVASLRKLRGASGPVFHLPPFLEAEQFASAQHSRNEHRARLAAEYGLKPLQLWILTVAMMRRGDKLASFRALADALTRLRDLDWSLLVAGDGPARAEVESALHGAAADRVRFLGERDLDQLAALYAACDVFAWPAVNEAYGMAMLEAQAAGLPVVSSNLRGVPDVVIDGTTGLLAAPGDTAAFAGLLRQLMESPQLRAAMSAAALHHIAGERSIAVAAQRLNAAFASVAGNHP